MKKGEQTTSEKIISAAIELLSKKGYANVSMRDISKEADVALSLLTYHFITKDNLFCAVVESLISKCYDEIQKKTAAGKDEHEYIILLIDYFKNLLTENADMMRIFIDFSSQALWNKSFRRQVRRLFDNITELIKEKALGFADYCKTAFGTYSSDTVAKFILGSIYGVTIQMMVRGQDDCDLENVFAFGNNLANYCEK